MDRSRGKYKSEGGRGVSAETNRIIRKSTTGAYGGTDFPIKDAMIAEMMNQKNSNSGSQTERTHSADQSYINIKDYYLNLDSWSKNISESNLSDGLIGYDLFTYFSNIGTLKYSIAIDEELVDSYEIKVHPFIIPEILLPASLFVFKRVYLDIKNISRNCIYYRLGGGSSKYHFEFSIGTPSGGTVELTPIKGRNKIILKHPLYELTKIIVQLKTPMRSIPLPNDVLSNNTLVPTTNPAQITSVSHGLTTGDLVFIQFFESTVSIVNNQMNSTDGLIVTVLDPDNFTVPVDATLILIPITGFIVYIQKNRIMVPMTFRGLTSDTTNFVVPVTS